MKHIISIKVIKEKNQKYVPLWIKYVGKSTNIVEDTGGGFYDNQEQLNRNKV